MAELPYRQIHMDFHTAPQIPGVGAAFDRQRFGRVLREARVGSINLCAKCHHGMYYYPTRIGTMHPSLRFDLLGEQIAGCRENGIRACIYTCAAWNEDWADRHPEWMQVTPEGTLGGKKPFTADYYSWRFLCLANRDHVAYLTSELDETWERYRPDGYWIDIIIQRRCVCPTCRADMRARGMDPTSEEDLRAHDRMVEIGFMREVFGFLAGKDPGLGVYFNGHPYEMDLGDRPELSAAQKRRWMTYVDIESLPSEAWGYTHFPIVANFLNRLDQEITMMNGKFHKSWGDFGSLRNLEALEYECFRALANGAKVCVGDQLHPSGAIDETVYHRIGEVFRGIEEREPWCRGTRKVAQIGVYAANRVLEGSAAELSASAEGAYRMLTQLHHAFDFIDYGVDLSPYELLILSDTVRLSEAEARRLSDWLARGGRLIATGTSGLDEAGARFALPELGVERLGPAPFQPRYARITPEHFPGIPPMDYVFYEQGQSVGAREGTEVLAVVVDPYFNRTWEHFCSHRQTPPAGASGEPCIVASRNTAYVSQPLFRDYAVNGNRVYRDIIARLIARLLERPVLLADLPTTAEITLRRQGEDLVLHILHYIVERRCRSMDIVEEKLPLFDRSISVRTAGKPGRVFLAPSRAELACAWKDGYATFTVPEIRGHLMAVIEGAAQAPAGPPRSPRRPPG